MLLTQNPIRSLCFCRVNGSSISPFYYAESLQPWILPKFLPWTLPSKEILLPVFLPWISSRFWPPGISLSAVNLGKISIFLAGSCQDFSRQELNFHTGTPARFSWPLGFLFPPRILLGPAKIAVLFYKCVFRIKELPAPQRNIITELSRYASLYW